jgi:hypothetical protein
VALVDSTLFCHPEPSARDLLLIDSTTAIVEAFLLGRWFRSLPRASYFSFLVKRKGNQKKAHPVGCARRYAPGPQDSRGFSTRRPCLVEKRAASLPRALRA